MKFILNHPLVSIFIRSLLVLSLVCVLLHWSARPTAAIYQTNLVGPAGSSKFGYSVTALPNGNLVITDPLYDAGTTAYVGAVYLYNGLTGALISTLTGSTANDQIGNPGVIVLTNGNFVVRSTYWDSGTAANVGAVTWGSGIIGVSGVVSSTNSLVGSTVNDMVGNYGVTALTNGNYVVRSPNWNYGTATDAGAATWGSGSTGIIGLVSFANSLVGSTAYDQVGSSVIPLTNGNYVVGSQFWDNLTNTEAGAASWVNGSTGLPTGTVSSSNSLVGSQSDDQVGIGVTALSNGNYVVRSPNWDNGVMTNVGASTWGSGTSGKVGLVSTSNSLYGATSDDRVSSSGVTPLNNGNYVVGSIFWDNGAMVDMGAATWGDGTSGTTGPVSTSNSLVGSSSNDNVGYGVTALTNGNYVVSSPNWDNSATADVGAATWVQGAATSFDVVSSSNSLIGSTNGDKVGKYVTALSNGNYVVRSPSWDDSGTANVGAATLGNGSTGTIGIVSSINSLVGSTIDDQVGFFGTALTNGNYVVGSPYWDNNSVADAGAATWVNGTSGVIGPVSSSNSLVGATASGQVGSSGMTALSNGGYVVSSPYWNNNSVADVGAVTWGNGTSGITGPISSTNSLVGSTTSDFIGQVTSLKNGDYVVKSQSWDYGPSSNSGAVTWGLGTGGLTGSITGENSVLGLAMDGGTGMNFTHNMVFGYLAVGRPAENLVTLFWIPRVYLPVAKK